MVRIHLDKHQPSLYLLSVRHSTFKICPCFRKPSAVTGPRACTFWAIINSEHLSQYIPYLGYVVERCMFYRRSGANRATLTNVVGGSGVKKSFMDRFLLMSPSIFLSGLHCMGLEVCVLTKPVQLHSVCG